METNFSENKRIYNLGREVPSTAVKKIKGGAYGAAGLSDINPQWRIEKLTEIFGPCGIGWYYDPQRIWVETVGDSQTMYAHVALYHRVGKPGDEWSKAVYGYGGTKLTGRDDDAVKSTITDALSNACRYLGIGANVWLAQYDTKYSAPPPEPASQIDKIIAEIDTVAKRLPKLGVTKESIGEAIKINCGTANYRKIKEVEKANAVLSALKALKGDKI